MPFGTTFQQIENATENLLKALIALLLSGTPGWTRTTGQWLKRTLFALEYQALTESSDVRVTIFCPGLSRNTDLYDLPPVVGTLVMLHIWRLPRPHFLYQV